MKVEDKRGVVNPQPFRDIPIGTLYEWLTGGARYIKLAGDNTTRAVSLEDYKVYVPDPGLRVIPLNAKIVIED